jgi:hypothetical protein
MGSDCRVAVMQDSMARSIFTRGLLMGLRVFCYTENFIQRHIGGTTLCRLTKVNERMVRKEKHYENSINNRRK